MEMGHTTLRLPRFVPPNKGGLSPGRAAPQPPGLFLSLASINTARSIADITFSPWQRERQHNLFGELRLTRRLRGVRPVQVFLSVCQSQELLFQAKMLFAGFR